MTSGITASISAIASYRKARPVKLSTIRLDRRGFIAAVPIALIACSGRAEDSQAQAQGAPPAVATEITVYKTPTCGCCTAWAEHLEAANFTVRQVVIEDTTPVAMRLGVPGALRSCHTAEINGYAVEGHVPAADIRRMIEERPAIAGIAVPGMPVGSPGMEMGDRRDPYQVIAFTAQGDTEVFASYGS